MGGGSDIRAKLLNDGFREVQELKPMNSNKGALEGPRENTVDETDRQSPHEITGIFEIFFDSWKIHTPPEL